VLLDTADLARLLGRGHVLVDDADAAFLGDRDREPGLGDGVHRGRDQGQVQPDPARQAGGKVDFARQDVRVRGYEQDVVEGECFLDDSHGRQSRGGPNEAAHSTTAGARM
jgi:hypothetical protein